MTGSWGDICIRRREVVTTSTDQKSRKEMLEEIGCQYLIDITEKSRKPLRGVEDLEITRWMRERSLRELDKNLAVIARVTIALIITIMVIEITTTATNFI